MAHHQFNEDLSQLRSDEELALETIYGEDFSKLAKKGAWGSSIISIAIKPPDLPASDVGSSLKLVAEIGKQYPYVSPKLGFEDVRGLSAKEARECLELCQKRANECAVAGQEMMCELVMSIEDYLLEHNRTPKEQNMSAWEQMKARERKEQMECQLKLNQEQKHQEALEEYRSVSQTQLVDFDTAEGERLKRELVKQMAALDEVGGAGRKRSIAVENEYHHLNGEQGRIEDQDRENDSLDDNNIDDEYREPTSSRYLNDFIELGLLGKGGFGEVVKVRNRLDRRIYAVKKIPLEPENGKLAKFAALRNRKIRREVTTISRMIHKNIVRYYQAWIEGEDQKDDFNDRELENIATVAPSMDSDSSDSGDEGSDESVSNWWDVSPEIRPTHSPDWSSDDSGFEDLSEHHYEQFDLNTSSVNESPFSKNLRNHNNRTFEESYEGDSDPLASKKFDRLIYIQMEYCSTTLRELIDQDRVRKSFEHEEEWIEAWRLTRQIIEALSYIHSQDVIHRDLKPSNIFIDSEKNVRVGDFGLATSSRSKSCEVAADGSFDEIEEKSSSANGDEINNMITSGPGFSRSTNSLARESLTGGVGTAYYRAPEQEGVNSNYDSRADIFSLGVILFELFHAPFSTGMERSQTLTKLRGDDSSGHNLGKKIGFDPNSSISWKDYAVSRFPETFEAPDSMKRIIIWCLQRDPSTRPTAEVLLKSDLVPRRMEVEQRYLDEALQMLTTHSENSEHITKALFNQNTPQHVEITFDSDLSIKAAHQLRILKTKNNVMTALQGLGGIKWGNVGDNISTSMGSLATATVSQSLNLSKDIGKYERPKDGVVNLGTAQKAAVSLSLSAGASSAISGHAGGSLGSVPLIMESFVLKTRSIFRSHGALQMSAPLLRPRLDDDKKASSYKTTKPAIPVNIMNERGTVLVLPDDLTANFARAVARGGAAASNLKRYDIGPVYLRSPMENRIHVHPKEAIEAAFDILVDDPCSKPELMEAETIVVLAQVLTEMKSYAFSSSQNNKRLGPLWFLRINHTRLVDSLIDIIGIPTQNYNLRSDCLKLLSLSLTNINNLKKAELQQEIDKHYDRLTSGPSKLTPKAKSRLSKFISFCGHFRNNIESSIDSLEGGVRVLHSMEAGNDPGNKRSKRFDDMNRGIRSIRRFLGALKAIGLLRIDTDTSKNEEDQLANELNYPEYISLDLGMCQSQQHIHGGLYFEAYVYSDNNPNTDTNRKKKKSELTYIKVAEGGRYEDLIRKFRPPGIFAQNEVSAYTSATIPIAVGLRIGLGRIVETLYKMASAAKNLSFDNVMNQSTSSRIQHLQSALGHPIMHTFLDCIVASSYGFDGASLGIRAIVATSLWRAGIACEYIPQSSVMMSILKRGDNGDEFSSNWSLDDICGVACMLRIPFVVVVQAHMLKEKGSVRLRRISIDGSAHEELVPLDELPAFIREKSEFSKKDEVTDDVNKTQQYQAGSRESFHSTHFTGMVDVACTIVEGDKFIDDNYLSRVGNTKTKDIIATKKKMKSVRQRAQNHIHHTYFESFTNDSASHVVGVDLSFLLLREFGTALMTKDEEKKNRKSITYMLEASHEVGTRHPKHAKVFKMLAHALESVMKDLHEANSCMYDESQTSILLYSNTDDKFDLLTLSSAPFIEDHRGKKRNC